MTTTTQKIPSGYKQTEIGVIPSDWSTKQLKSLVSEVIDNRGKTPPYSNNPDVELIETTSISFVTKYPNYSKITKFVSKKTYDNWFRAHPIKDDLLVSTVGEYSGSSAMMGENRGTIAQNLIALRIKDVNPTYVFYWTRSGNFKEQLDQVMMSQAQPSLRVPWLLNFYLNIPKPEEQTVIVSVLSDTDLLIESLKNLIKKKKNIKQGVMQELLTGKRRLPGFNDKWETKKLGELLDYEQPTKYLVKDTEYQDNYTTPVLTAGKTFILGYTNEDAGIFKDLPVIIFDDFTTATKFVDFPFKAKSSAMKMLKPRNKDINLRFVFEKMRMIDFKLGDHKRYWISEYQNIEIDTPKPDEQKAIATVLSDMDTEIEKLESQLTKYQNIKQGMMQTLLTGKIRLLHPVR